jgi:hypothetical protein
MPPKGVLRSSRRARREVRLRPVGLRGWQATSMQPKGVFRSSRRARRETKRWGDRWQQLSRKTKRVSVLWLRFERGTFRTPSVCSKRLEGAFEHFVDAQCQSDQDIADLIRRLEIDIAV